MTFDMKGEGSWLDAAMSAGALPEMASMAGSPELGDDILSIRRRVVAEAARRSGESVPDALLEALKSKYQVDLHAESNVAGLEDPGLIKHIAEARELFLSSETRALPDRDAIQAARVDNAKRAAVVVEKLDESLLVLRQQVENTLLEADNATKLAEGRLPHGYPAPLSPATALPALSLRLKKNAAAYEQVCVGLEAALKEQTLLRRGYEEIVGNLMDRLRGRTVTSGAVAPLCLP